MSHDIIMSILQDATPPDRNMQAYPFYDSLSTVAKEITSRSPWVREFSVLDIKHLDDSNPRNLWITCYAVFCSGRMGSRYFRLNLAHPRLDRTADYEYYKSEELINQALERLNTNVRETYPALDNREEQIEWCRRHCVHPFVACDDVEAVKRWERGEKLTIDFESPEDEIVFRLTWL